MKSSERIFGTTTGISSYFDFENPVNVLEGRMTSCATIAWCIGLHHAVSLCVHLPVGYVFGLKRHALHRRRQAVGMGRCIARSCAEKNHRTGQQDYIKLRRMIQTRPVRKRLTPREVVLLQFQPLETRSLQGFRSPLPVIFISPRPCLPAD